jgi:small subunit ribosomal protein S1
MSPEEKKTNGKESFAALLEESPALQIDLVGTVLKGTVIDINGDCAIIDVGLKSEGRVPLKEFGPDADKLKKYDEVDVYVERMEDREGMIALSHEKARREAVWKELETAHEKTQQVLGTIFGRVKGGFTVDLKGAVAFLPGSQLDVRPIKDVSPLMNIEQPFMILKMDRTRGNIVVSRRAVLEESRTEARGELLSKIEEGVIIDGVVKNITDYGAFIDLGGIDGLLHITDMSWRRLNHPTEMIQLGQTIKVQVIRYNRESGRISLGMKQLEKDPWEGIGDRVAVGQKIKGQITNITDYGAFVEIEPGVEGLIHVSEMSWTKKNVHPGKIVSSSQEIEAVILEIDPTKRRIALGMKQIITNPWQQAALDHPTGSTFEGKIRNITEFGLFVAITDDLDGMVHMSDISWQEAPEKAMKKYKINDVIQVKVLEVDPDKERIALGIKQLTEDPFAQGIATLKKNDVVTCEIIKITDSGLEVKVAGELSGFIRRVDLARERHEQRTDRFAVGEKVDAKVLAIDKKTRKVSLSIKAREIAEEKEAMAAYGSTDSGASLGDILGAALDKAKQKSEIKKAEKQKPIKHAAAKKPETDAKEPVEEKPAKKATAKKAETDSDEHIEEKSAKKATAKKAETDAEDSAKAKPAKQATKKTTKKATKKE